MANIFKSEIQDYQGNIIYPHTKADVTFCKDGKSVQEEVDKYESALGTIEGITDNPDTDDATKLPTSKVTSALKNMVNALTNTVSEHTTSIEDTSNSVLNLSNSLSSVSRMATAASDSVAQLKKSFQDGCSLIAGKITSLGVATASNASPETISKNVETLANNKYNNGFAAGYGSKQFEISRLTLKLESKTLGWERTILNANGFNRMTINSVNFSDNANLVFAVKYNGDSNAELVIDDNLIVDRDPKTVTVNGGSYTFDISSANTIELYLTAEENGYGRIDVYNVKLFNA